jgi:hypothetical protein
MFIGISIVYFAEFRDPVIRFLLGIKISVLDIQKA